MHDAITHRQFFGDQERDFCLTAPLVLELERKAGPFGSIVRRVLARDFSSTEIVEVIRLALIGGGSGPQEAQALIEAYVHPRPLAEAYLLAVDILDTRMTGKAPVQQIAPTEDTDDAAE